MKHFFLLLLNLQILLAQTPTGGGIVRVNMNPNLPANAVSQPLGKENPLFQLVFADNFDSLNLRKWNLGEKGDDIAKCDGAGVMKLPRLVSVTPEGYLKLDIKEENCEGCPVIAGEVKTVSTFDDFHSYWLYPGSYLEIRAMMPFGANVGSSGWLYGAWQKQYHEIDIWENYRKEADSYQTDYIWGETQQTTDLISTKIKLQDEAGKSFSFEGKWMIFGLSWENNKIKYYINNQLFQELDLTQKPPKGVLDHTPAYYPTSPFELRIGVGGHLNTNPKIKKRKITLPNGESKSLLVDYVRVYRLPTYKIIQDTDIPKEICMYADGSNGANIGCTYYPDASYTWSSPAFDFKPNMPPHIFNHNQWMTIKKGTELGKSYPVTLTISFPWGYSETRTWEVATDPCRN